MSKHFKNPKLFRESSAMAVTPKLFALYKTTQPFVAESIRNNPTLWVEFPIKAEPHTVGPIEGNQIEFPIIGTEFRITYQDNAVGQFLFKNLLLELSSRVALRFFIHLDTDDMYFCFNADPGIIDEVLALNEQIYRRIVAQN